MVPLRWPCAAQVVGTAAEQALEVPAAAGEGDDVLTIGVARWWSGCRARRWVAVDPALAVPSFEQHAGVPVAGGDGVDVGDAGGDRGQALGDGGAVGEGCRAVVAPALDGAVVEQSAGVMALTLMCATLERPVTDTGRLGW
jgi:hypothetical protein